jgi:hypothetical protein
MKLPTDEIPPLEPRPSTYPALERLTTGVLLVFIMTLAWIITVAYIPGFCRLMTVECEVILMLVLLVAALGLVSLVALLHTR